MSSIVAPELDSSDLRLLVKVDSLNAVHAGFYVFLSVQHLLRGNVAHFDIIWQQPTGHNIRWNMITHHVMINNYKYCDPKSKIHVHNVRNGARCKKLKAIALKQSTTRGICTNHLSESLQFFQHQLYMRTFIHCYLIFINSTIPPVTGSLEYWGWWLAWHQCTRHWKVISL